MGGPPPRPAAQPSLVPCHLDNKVGGGAQLLAPAAPPQSAQQPQISLNGLASKLRIPAHLMWDPAWCQCTNCKHTEIIHSQIFWIILVLFFRGLCLDKLRPHGIACHGGRHVQIGSYFNNVHASWVGLGWCWGSATIFI